MGKALVHVIKPTGGRFEMAFDSALPDEEILAKIELVKVLFGYNGTVQKADLESPLPMRTDFSDESSGFALDNPKTQIVILKTDDRGNAVLDAKKNPIVVKYLRGSPPE